MVEATIWTLFRRDPRLVALRKLEGLVGRHPPYHAPPFVLTHHPRASIGMLGGTTFHFVTDGIEEGLERAREAAGDKDVKIGGGVATIRQYVGHVDEIHLA